MRLTRVFLAGQPAAVAADCRVERAARPHRAPPALVLGPVQLALLARQHGLLSPPRSLPYTGTLSQTHTQSDALIIEFPASEPALV